MLKGTRPLYETTHGIDIRSIVSISWSTTPGARPNIHIIEEYLMELMLSKRPKR